MLAAVARAACARRSRRRSAARSARRSPGSAACRASRTAGAGSGRSRSASRPCSCGRRGWCAARSPPSAGCRRSRRRRAATPAARTGARRRSAIRGSGAGPSANRMSKASVRLARARDAGDHREAVARDLDVDVLQVVLARVVDADATLRVAAAPARLARRRCRAACADWRRKRHARTRAAPCRCASVACAIDLAPACPRTTISPPASPPSGPRSMIQSAARITSRLCSITTSECPAASSWRNARSSFATSSKCRPVVGSSNRNSVPAAASDRSPASDAARGLGQVAGELQALRFAAGERRHRLAEPAGTRGRRRPAAAARACTSRSPAKNASASRDRHLEHVGDRACAVAVVHLEHLGAEAPAVAVRAAQVDVGEELHLDVLEAVAAAGRAAAVAGVEAERAGV